MKNTHILILLLIINAAFSENLQAQSPAPIKWINPAALTTNIVEGKFWKTDTASFYHRLPAIAKEVVRKEVWQLSTNSAGVYMRFSTDATQLTVRYQVKGSLQMPHMPATGVSGLDLYGLDQQGNWHWVKGRYQFGDTISYTFHLANKGIQIKEFRLYLPLYNTVNWLQLGVPEKAAWKEIAARTDGAVIVYGTSIMQGACASRPGLAWTNILGRKLNDPIINLGFSGNGRMEKELIELIAATSPKLVVLDCLPNMTDSAVYPESVLLERYTYAVERIRRSNPIVPILLVEHCCGLPGTNLDEGFRKNYEAASQRLNRVYQELTKAGTKNLHLLTAEAIGFTIESTVDGTHPNDIGMLSYAAAYEQLIKTILKN